MSILNRVFCEKSIIELSSITRLIKSRNITSEIGRSLLGDLAIEYSKDIFAKKPWDDVGKLYGVEVFPILAAPNDKEGYVNRRYKWSDCVLETNFSKNDKSNLGKKEELAKKEIYYAVCALRIIGKAPINEFGPIIYKNTEDNSPAISFGAINNNLYPEIEGDEFLFLNRIDCKSFVKLFKRINKSNSSVIEIALHRLNLSLTRGAYIDHFIDIMIGLEALYLVGTRNELSFRLCTRISYHQGDSPERRLGIFQKIKFLYDTRSKLVHGEVKNISEIVDKNKSPYTDEKTLVCAARDFLRTGLKIIIFDLEPGITLLEYFKNIDENMISGK